eukprot:1167876_1
MSFAVSLPLPSLNNNDTLPLEAKSNDVHSPNENIQNNSPLPLSENAQALSKLQQLRIRSGQILAVLIPQVIGNDVIYSFIRKKRDTTTRKDIDHEMQIKLCWKANRLILQEQQDTGEWKTQNK